MLENNDEWRTAPSIFSNTASISPISWCGHPELLTEVERACGEKQGRTGFAAPRDAAELRRFFRQQMVRIQSDSVYHRVPVSSTLQAHVRSGGIHHRGGVRCRGGGSFAATPPASPGYAAVEPDDGHRARPAGHARIRSGFRCRSGIS